MICTKGERKMNKPALVIMAAGMGSRYGGLKQIDPIGPNNEIIMDYSIYDALKAGFGKIVFVINKNMKKTFREVIGKKIEKITDTAYVYQSIDDLPVGYCVPDGREKPWGTGHAVLSCRYAVNTPFAVINADDFYGPSSFAIMCDYLKGVNDFGTVSQYSMVGFELENTLTENGHVARGICKVNPEGHLEEIRERTKIKKIMGVVKYAEDDDNWVEIPAGSIVSMNFWGFTPSIFDELEMGFPKFLEAHKDNILKAEYFLPDLVGELVLKGKANVKVLQSGERWYGVTYKEDKPMIKQAIAQMVKQGIYPEKLWR